jgi:hypothetical protein
MDHRKSINAKIRQASGGLTDLLDRIDPPGHRRKEKATTLGAGLDSLLSVYLAHLYS